MSNNIKAKVIAGETIKAKMNNAIVYEQPAEIEELVDDINNEEVEGTVIDKLNYLDDTKGLIKEAIIDKGVEVEDEDTFRSYADKISSIPAGENINDYFLTSGANENNYRISSFIKKIPEIDTSEVTNFESMFENCPLITNIPQIDTSNATTMSWMFAGCSSITSIPELNAEKVEDVSSVLNECGALTTFGGFKDLGKAFETTMSQNWYAYYLDLGWCENLTHDSLMNIINKLYDIATAGVKQQTIALGPINYDKLTANEIAIATNKGWNVERGE